MTTAVNIIKSINDNRQELISKFFTLKAKKQQITQTIMTGCETKEESYRLWNEREDLACEISNLFTAINDLGNALGHLGYSVKTFWGK